jgi:hypothetical protein
MIECYYRWCPFHHKDEPFCFVELDGVPTCIATPEQLAEYSKLRREELAQLMAMSDYD